MIPLQIYKMICISLEGKGSKDNIHSVAFIETRRFFWVSDKNVS